MMMHWLCPNITCVYLKRKWWKEHFICVVKLTIVFLSKENGQLAERRANEHFERLFETLQERKSEMLRSIEQSRSRRLDQLKAQVRSTRSWNFPFC